MLNKKGVIKKCIKKNYKNRVIKKITDPPSPPAHFLGVGFLNPMSTFGTASLQNKPIPREGHLGIGFKGQQ